MRYARPQAAPSAGAGTQFPQAAAKGHRNVRRLPAPSPLHGLLRGATGPRGRRHPARPGASAGAPAGCNPVDSRSRLPARLPPNESLPIGSRGGRGRPGRGLDGHGAGIGPATGQEVFSGSLAEGTAGPKRCIWMGKPCACPLRTGPTWKECRRKWTTPQEGGCCPT